MPRSQFLAMQYAFMCQFEKYMVMDGHCDLSVQFWVGWKASIAIDGR